MQHYKNPIIQVKDVQKITKTSYKSVNDFVYDFVGAGILQEMIGQSRNRVFVFDDYLKLF